MQNFGSTVLLAAVCAASLVIGGCGSSGSSADGGSDSETTLTSGQSIDYTDAAPGLGFPQSPAPLLGALADRDESAMRRHVWNVWAALTQPSNSGIPDVLTWYTSDEVYGGVDSAAARKFTMGFYSPPTRTLGDGDPILSYNVFNAPLRDHVHANDYQYTATIAALAGHVSDVVPFPADAVSIKTVWWPVRHDGLTAFPVWDNEPTRPSQWGRGISDLIADGYYDELNVDELAELATREYDGNDFETFRRLVAIDPSDTEPSARTAAVSFFDPDDLTLESNVTRTASVVGLNRFFYVQVLDTATLNVVHAVPLIDQITTRFWDRPFEAGDYLALIAVHVTTREIPDWVWGTFWWHDRPNESPYGADRPATVPPVFRNYLMDATFNADVPREPNGDPNVAFNPYLEAAFSDGPRSNCVACHQRASVGADGPAPALPVLLGALSPDDPFYDGRVRLDLLWELAFETR